MKRMTSAVALIAASLLGLTACGSSGDPLASSSPSGSASASGGSGGPIVVGGANFSESTLLAEIYAGALKAKGIDATTKLNIGSREIYLRALEDNSVQVFPEYTGALAFNYDKEYTGTDPDEVYTARPGGPAEDARGARQVGRRGQRLDGGHQEDRDREQPQDRG